MHGTSYIDLSRVSGSNPLRHRQVALRVHVDTEDAEPLSMNATARFSAVVVLATPPFWFANAMTFGLCGA